jgi:hypothetical protein
VYRPDNTTWRFSKEYYRYLNSPKSKTVDDVSPPRKYNGKIISDFDDYEEVINGYRQTATEEN